METPLSIIAIVISVISGGFAFYTFFWTARRDRKQATLDAYNTLQEQALDALNEYTAAEIKRIIEEKNKEEYRQLSKCLARLEHFSVGANTGIYDKKTIYELAHGFLDVAIWYKLQPVLEQKQKGRQETYYGNYIALVEWMKAQKKDTP